MKSRILLTKCSFIICVIIFLLLTANLETYATHEGPSRHSFLERFFTWSDFVDRWKSLADNGQQLIDFTIVQDEDKVW